MSAKVQSQASLQGLANELAQRAHDQIPERDTWGLFASEDSPVLAGGGSGGFLWFGSREEMHEFIAQHVGFWYVNSLAPDPGNIGLELGRILSRFERQQVDCKTARERVNQLLAGSVQIAWWGQFWELVSGENEFACNVIEWFRSMANPPGNGVTLCASDHLQLAKMIKEYGA
jgi:hypothetical protein